MTETPKFDPQRSAAIRHLLIENVEAEPKRRTRHLRALLAGLIITGVVASGSTALALNRDHLFGAPTAAPPASPTSTTGSTASPVPTTPATPDEIDSSGPAVTGDPIAPRDVPSPPSGSGWTLEMPHSAEPCQDRRAYTVADGLALVQVGPIRADDNPGCLRTNDGMTLSLVDTSSGGLLWTREWKWDTEIEGQGSAYVDTSLLGTSGRVLVDSQMDRSGPSEVLDLATGQTVAPFTPSSGNEHVYEVSPVPGDSGDVIATFRELDDDANQAPFGMVKRLDPRDAQNPIWSTRVEGTDVSAREVTNQMTFTSLTYAPISQTRYASAVLDLTSGSVSLRDERTDYEFFTGYTIRPSDYDETEAPRTLNGFDDNGDELWTRAVGPESSVSEVLTSSVRPGDPVDVGPRVGNGQFVIGSPTSISLVDGLTGETVWETDATDCGTLPGAYGQFAVRLSPDGSAVTIGNDVDRPCRFDSATGARLADSAVPRHFSSAYGTALNYDIVDGVGTATDAQTGAVVWSTPTDAFWWFYAGGYLVYFDGFTLRSVG